MTEAFIDAIIAAAQVPEDGEDNRSALEKDFENGWPDALQFLPPRGQEPTQRPSTAYSPDSLRQEIFEGYTFVFYDSGQFDNLLAPITNGCGKALLRTVEPDVSTADDFVGYVKNVAGEKGLGVFEDGSEGKGVVVVRFQPKKGTALAWFAQFGIDVSQLLDHRLIEQSEFLDAILNNDASILRQALEPEPSRMTPPPPTAGM